MSYLVLGLVAGLANVERKGFLQAMLSRPIALGSLTGLALGDVTAGLFVAGPLELLWLGAVNMGAALPVHEALGTAAITGGAVLGLKALRAAGLAGPLLLPAVAVLCVVVCAPLALVGRRADGLFEAQNARLHARAERALAEERLEAAARANLHGLALPFLLGLLLAPLGAAVAAEVARRVVQGAPAALAALALGWVAFTGFACASGARAIRGAHAGAFYYGAMVVGLSMSFATTLAGARS